MKNIEQTQSILVIEDDPTVALLLRRILEPEGFNVSTAGDGVRGMALLEENKPDLVLLDVMMPGPDGYEILKRIRQVSTVPVIMVTARCEVDSIGRALGLGADDYVRKPFLPLELVARVKAKLRRSKRRINDRSTGLQSGASL